MGSETITTDFEPFLRPTAYIDSDHPDVIAYARDLTGSGGTDIERARRIFYGVRDDILYTPYGLAYTPETMTASYTLDERAGFCVQKALLLAAAARAVGIPSRLGFVDVRNHLSTERLLKLLGTDLFIYHGYADLWLDGSWVKATPAFNLSLCERFGVLPLEFDGVHDSVLQPFDSSGNRHMEYVRDRGSFADLPYEQLWDEYEALYPGLFATSLEATGRTEGNFGAEAAAERSDTS
jgi:transglutaminase-like putative cysteine protease